MPRDPYRAMNLPRAEAYAAIASGKFTAAIEALGRAMKLEDSPSLSEAFYMGMAHDRAGHADSAIAWYARAVKTGDQSRFPTALLTPAAHRRLGELYDAQGNTAKAIEHYEWFANRWKNADPELQPTVRAVKARVAALRSKQAPG
jgi:tetratricopeptide (TPR) repeat protein